MTEVAMGYVCRIPMHFLHFLHFLVNINSRPITHSTAARQE